MPTRELASQVNKAILALSAFCSKDIQSVNLTPQIHDQAQRALLVSSPDIVVSTPARALHHINGGALSVEKLRHVVIDEADLVLSYGYDVDFQQIAKLLPSGIQTFLASATLTTEVDTLKSLFCRDPSIVNLEDEEKESNTVSQYMVRCAEDEKFLLLFAIFKLKLIQGKSIVFVGDVDRCYLTKLFLEQFGIKSCVLNSELPVNSRIHVVEEFNRNVYDIIIATDENEIAGDEQRPRKPDPAQQKTEAPEDPRTRNNPAPNEADTSTNANARGSNTGNREEDPKPPPKKQRKDNPNKKREYGISRGIDFQHVTLVLNFDLPTSPTSYTHRIGRTARAGRAGIALSFAIPAAHYRKHKPVSFLTTAHDETVLASISASQAKRGLKVDPYNFEMQKLEGFKYRVGSALKAVTPGAIRQARLGELRREILGSERLKRWMEENPEEGRWVRHDLEVRSARVLPHLRHVPDYLMPGKAGAVGGGDSKGLEKIGYVGVGRQSENRIRKARERNKLKGKGKKKADPLKTFQAKGKK